MPPARPLALKKAISLLYQEDEISSLFQDEADLYTAQVIVQAVIVHKSAVMADNVETLSLFAVIVFDAISFAVIVFDAISFAVIVFDAISFAVIVFDAMLLAVINSLVTVQNAVYIASFGDEDLFATHNNILPTHTLSLAVVVCATVLVQS